MIITRTPLRISLVGGGSDLSEFLKNNSGLVVGGSINKYSFILARKMHSFNNYLSRFVYSETETVQNNYDVKHRAINACLKHLEYKDGIEIFHSSDIPSSSGTGSSSSFIVGLLNALATSQKKRLLPFELAEQAIKIEQKDMQEHVGMQDQVFAAYGGLNIIRFFRNGEISVIPMNLDDEHIKSLERHILLVYTGIQRSSSEITKSYTKATPIQMVSLAERAIETIHYMDYVELGKIIDASWRLKCSLSDKVCNQQISEIYTRGRNAGAWGAKLCGSGAGGIMLFICPPERRKDVINNMPSGLIEVPFRFDFSGSSVIFSDRD